MKFPAAFVAVSLSLGIFAGSILVSVFSAPQPWTPEQVLLARGSTFRFSGSNEVGFTVPTTGGVFVGSAEVDHNVSIELLRLPVFLSCGAQYGSSAYHGDAWYYSINETLAPGQYSWGPTCGGTANITVTQTIEVLYP
jgi:hypothetical protein